MTRRTKIVATLGPASVREETLAAMIDAGMDVARLNTSHSTLEHHIEVLGMVREVATRKRRHIAVLMDLGGPKLRTGGTPDGRLLQLTPGSTVAVEQGEGLSEDGAISVDYPRLLADVRPRDRILLDDGNLELEVESTNREALECRVLVGGPLGPHKGVALPNSVLTLPALTDRDREAIAAGVAAGVDLFALSFVRDAQDIVLTRAIINSHGADTPIIAKIERRQAVANLETIVAEADGAMVARGDLGVELHPEDVPVQQRRIIAASNRHMIPVITATQMLESMVSSPRPTRAEASDVANAVWDGSDAVMLSGETAIGQYPVQSVAMMDRIIRRAEESSQGARDNMGQPDTDDHSYIVAVAARRIVESDANMRGVVCFTRSGYSASLLSKVHPNAEIFGLSPSEQVCRRLALARGVMPIHAPLVTTSEDMLEEVDRLLLDGGLLSPGDEVVVVASLPVSAAGTTNFLKLHRLGESAAYK